MKSGRDVLSKSGAATLSFTYHGKVRTRWWLLAHPCPALSSKLCNRRACSHTATRKGICGWSTATTSMTRTTSKYNSSTEVISPNDHKSQLRAPLRSGRHDEERMIGDMHCLVEEMIKMCPAELRMMPHHVACIRRYCGTHWDMNGVRPPSGGSCRCRLTS